MKHQEAETEWKCPPHWWIVDRFGVGRCKYCPAVKDFAEEQKRWVESHKVYDDSGRGRLKGTF